MNYIGGMFSAATRRQRGDLSKTATVGGLGSIAQIISLWLQARSMTPAATMPNDAPKGVFVSRRQLALTASLVVATVVFSGIGMLKSILNAKDEMRGTYFTAMGMRPARTLYAETFGRFFLKKKDKYRLALVCLHWYAKGDILDAPGLQKSGLYDIKDETITLYVSVDSAFDMEVRSGSRGTNYVMLLVPLGVSMDSFSTLRQAEALGVKNLEIMSGPP